MKYCLNTHHKFTDLQLPTWEVLYGVCWRYFLVRWSRSWMVMIEAPTWSKELSSTKSHHEILNKMWNSLCALQTFLYRNPISCDSVYFFWYLNKNPPVSLPRWIFPRKDFVEIMIVAGVTTSIVTVGMWETLFAVQWYRDSMRKKFETYLSISLIPFGLRLTLSSLSSPSASSSPAASTPRCGEDKELLDWVLLVVQTKTLRRKCLPNTNPPFFPPSNCLHHFQGLTIYFRTKTFWC